MNLFNFINFIVKRILVILAPFRRTTTFLQGNNTIDEKKIVQICIVAKNIDRLMKQYWDILGIGPWDVYTFNQDTLSEFKVQGRSVGDFEYKLALANFGDTQLELIQPVKNVPIYENFLREKGEGIHHIKEMVDDKDIERRVEKFKRKGIEVTVSGKFGQDIFVYLDTEPTLGMIYEIGNCGTIPPPERKYPPEIET